MLKGDSYQLGGVVANPELGAVGFFLLAHVIEIIPACWRFRTQLSLDMHEHRKKKGKEKYMPLLGELAANTSHTKT